MQKNEKEMNAKELFDYRVKLFRDAMAWKKPERTPFSANVTHWMFQDAGYTTGYAVRHYDVIEECMIRFYKKYDIDHFNIYMSGFRNYNAVTDLLGECNDGYAGNDENLINCIVEDVISSDEYDYFLEDMNKACWERFLSRRYKQMKNMSPRQFAESVKEDYHYRQERARIEARLRNEFGILMDYGCAASYSSLENVLAGMRGLKGLSIDLRRHYDKVLAYTQAFDAEPREWALSAMATHEGWDMSQPYDYMTYMIPHTIMRPKQFEELMWPAFKPILEYAAAHGQQTINFAEGSWKALGKYFNDFPKGVVCMMVESDDPYEIRKLYPNIAIYGGLDTSVLGEGTPQQCIDMTKRAIDELGWDGGLILAPNKMLSYPKDVKPENFEAVSRFIHEYK